MKIIKIWKLDPVNNNKSVLIYAAGVNLNFSEANYSD